MVNNNTPKNNSTTAVVTSESSIYLKRSELPKNLSSFRNDVGYISSTTLNLWMKEHSYLSKDEITELIRKSNLTVIDSVNRTYDDDAISRLNEEIISVKGEIVAIKDRLGKMDGDFISSDKERTFATKGDVRNINNKIDTVEETINSIHIDTSSFAEKADIPTKVSELENDVHYITSHQSLVGYAKKSDLGVYAKKSDLTGLAKSEDIPSIEGLASQKWVKDQGYLTSHQSLAKYAKKTDLPNMSEYIRRDEIDMELSDELATQSWVKDQGYLTEHQSLAKYAKKTDIPDTSKFITLEDLDIPSTDGLASKEWVLSKGYLTEHQSLKNYAKKTDLPDMSEYLKADDIVIPPLEEIATMSWVEGQGYLKEHQSLKNYAKKSDLPSLDGYATEAWVMDKIPAGQDMSMYAKKSELEGYVKTNTLNKYVKKSDMDNYCYATQEWVNGQGFITELGDMSEYAKKTDIPNLSGYATQTWVKNNYLKKGSVYEKSEIDASFLKKEDAEDTYLSKADASDTYMKKSDVKREYLKIEDYRGLKDATTINTDYRNRTLEDLEQDLNTLKSGFYVVQGNNVVIVKQQPLINKSEIIKVYTGGTESSLTWIEDNS